MSGKCPAWEIAKAAIMQHSWPENLRHMQWPRTQYSSIHVRKISGMGNGHWPIMPLHSIHAGKSAAWAITM